MLPNRAQRRDIHRRMRAAVEQVRLPLRSRIWRGQAGNWLGAGSGSSIDFQDHRPYLPGDDPRYIDWQAYARTGHYTMKLYREEVSPVIDLVLDVSASMFFDETKSTRTLELFYFCLESARRSGAALRSYAADGAILHSLGNDEALAEDNFLEAKESGPPQLVRVPWRQGSLRVLISDLLFPGEIEAILTSLSVAKGRGLILAPFARAEAEPGWSGNIEMRDCETSRARVQRVTESLLARYQQTYQRHFSLWRERARKHAVVIARVGSEKDFLGALQAEALPAGALEFC